MVGMDHLSPLGKVELFRKRHGAYVVRDDGSVLYQDGAIEYPSMGGHDTIQMVEPPTHRWEVAKRKLEYFTILRERAEAKYTAAAQGLMNQTHPELPATHGAADVDDATESLQALKGEVNRLRKLEREAEAEVERTKPQMLKLREQNGERVRKQREALQHKIKHL